jgi:hypothetical protein
MIWRKPKCAVCKGEPGCVLCRRRNALAARRYRRRRSTRPRSMRCGLCSVTGHRRDVCPWEPTNEINPCREAV